MPPATPCPAKAANDKATPLQIPVGSGIPGGVPQNSGFQESAIQDSDRRRLAAIARQHEAAVFSYLYRRVRRSVDVNALVQEVFAQFVRIEGLRSAPAETRLLLLSASESVLESFIATAAPADAAWTALCLELDRLARARQKRS